MKKHFHEFSICVCMWEWHFPIHDFYILKIKMAFLIKSIVKWKHVNTHVLVKLCLSVNDWKTSIKNSKKIMMRFKRVQGFLVNVLYTIQNCHLHLQTITKFYINANALSWLSLNNLQSFIRNLANFNHFNKYYEFNSQQMCVS